MHLSLKGSLDRQPLVDRIGDKLLPTYPGAAAAYSLRALNGDANNVVRVRRASDNVERDFTAREVSSGDMVNWVNAQVVPPLDVRELVDGERTGDLIPAAAAYSLRNLSASYTGNVVDVRRSSDSLEESFTAAEVADGTLTDWVAEEQVGWNLEPTWQIASGGGSITSQSTTPETTTFTISNTGGDSLVRVIGKPNSILASAGDSVVINLDVSGLSTSNTKVNLITAASNTAVASQPINNGSNQEFTLTPSGSVGYITFSKFNTTIEASITINSIKVIGKSGFVTQWYDQSGNSKHATQSVIASQPKIVDAGVLVDGGMVFDNVDDALETSLVPPNTATLIGVANWDRENVSKMVFGARDSLNQRSYLAQLNTGLITMGVANSQLSTEEVVAGDDYLLFGIHDSPLRLLSTNGSVVSDLLGSNPNNTTHGYSIGALNSTGTDGTFMEGKIKEIIIYDSNQSDNRTAIEANIGETYGIDLPSGVDTGYDEVDGFVETWYDQSGNDNHATQATTSAQPQIVDGGVLVDGGIDFDGVNDFLGTTNSDLCNVDELSVFTVLTPHTTQSQASAFSCGSVVVNSTGYGGWKLNLNGYIDQAQFQTQAIGSGSISTVSNDVGSSDTLISYVADFPDASTFANGQAGTTITDNISPNNTNSGRRKFRIGCEFTFNATNFYTQPIKEIVLYTSDQSSNRTAIEDNINNYYEIY